MIDFTLALHHFEKEDTSLANVLRTWLDSDEPPVAPVKVDSSQYVDSLYSSIISQQISTSAARAIRGRFLDLVGDPHQAKNILKHSVEDFRSIGLSRQKASYILSIAELTSNGTVRVDHLDSLSDQEVIDELVLIKGVGVWTAEMFLMFTLARPDVFSAGDLGLLNAVKKLYILPELTKDELLKISTRWSPHRTVASLALWHTLDNKPQ